MTTLDPVILFFLLGLTAGLLRADLRLPPAIYDFLTILLLFVQMPGTLLPMVFFPQETFTIFPIAPTLEGQYIIKNFVLIGAGLIIGATVRGGYLITEPAVVDAPQHR